MYRRVSSPPQSARNTLSSVFETISQLFLNWEFVCPSGLNPPQENEFNGVNLNSNLGTRLVKPSNGSKSLELLRGTWLEIQISQRGYMSKNSPENYRFLVYLSLMCLTFSSVYYLFMHGDIFDLPRVWYLKSAFKALSHTSAVSKPATLLARDASAKKMSGSHTQLPTRAPCANSLPGFELEPFLRSSQRAHIVCL